MAENRRRGLRVVRTRPARERRGSQFLLAERRLQKRGGLRRPSHRTSASAPRPTATSVLNAQHLAERAECPLVTEVRRGECLIPHRPRPGGLEEQLERDAPVFGIGSWRFPLAPS